MSGSRSLPPTGTLLRGDGSFPFVARVDGDDIVVENVVCTFFGGTHDPMDNGETASGVSTKPQGSRGVALPMDKKGFSKTEGSPIPVLPWKTPIEITNLANRKTASAPLLDIGPSKHAASHAAIDLTEAVFVALGGSTHAGRMNVNFRILGGAAFVSADALVGSSASSEKDSGIAGFFAGLFGAKARGGIETSNSRTLRAASHGSDNPFPKPPVDTSFASPNHSNRQGTTVTKIVVHCTEGSLESALNEFMNDHNGRQVSAHFVIARDGRIFQMVSTDRAAHHCRGANLESIGIENVGSETDALSGPQTQALTVLLLYLMHNHGIARRNIFGHGFTPGHLTDTSCPDELFGGNEPKDLDAWLKTNIDPHLDGAASSIRSLFSSRLRSLGALTRDAEAASFDKPSHDVADDLTRDGLRRAIEADVLSMTIYRALRIDDVRRELGEAMPPVTDEDQRLDILNTSIRRKFRLVGWNVELPPVDWYKAAERQAERAPAIAEFILSHPITHS